MPRPDARRRALLAAAALSSLTPTIALAQRKIALKPGEKLRVAFVYVSPVGDAGWTTQHDHGRRQMEAKFAGKVETKFVEKVSEGADSERVIRDLASQGFHLVFTTSFGFMNPTLRVAKQFPNTLFEHATGYQSAPNVNNYNARFYEGRYLGGMVAGRMSKTGRIGYVAAFPIPEVLQGINAFTRGARAVNPKMETNVVWVNSWYDPGREREAATTLAGQGADVLTHHTDSPATMQLAEERKIMAVSYHSDMSRFGPTAQLAAVTHQWGDYYTRVVESVLAGTWKVTGVWGGIKEGMIRMDAYAKTLPKEFVETVEARGREIANGTFHPFTGPVRTNDGKTVLASGALTDEALHKMDYYVEGVTGSVPRAR